MGQCRSWLGWSEVTKPGSSSSLIRSSVHSSSSPILSPHFPNMSLHYVSLTSTIGFLTGCWSTWTRGEICAKIIRSSNVVMETPRSHGGFKGTIEKVEIVHRQLWRPEGVFKHIQSIIRIWRGHDLILELKGTSPGPPQNTRCLTQERTKRLDLCSEFPSLNKNTCWFVSGFLLIFHYPYANHGAGIWIPT